MTQYRKQVEYCLSILTSECCNLYELQGHDGRRRYVRVRLMKTVRSLQQRKKRKAAQQIKTLETKRAKLVSASATAAAEIDQEIKLLKHKQQ